MNQQNYPPSEGDDQQHRWAEGQPPQGGSQPPWWYPTAQGDQSPHQQQPQQSPQQRPTYLNGYPIGQQPGQSPYQQPYGQPYSGRYPYQGQPQPGYQHYPYPPGQFPAQRRKKTGKTVPVLITVAVLSGLLFLFSFFTDGDFQFFADQDSEPLSISEIAQDYSDDADELAESLHHIHSGIDVDWATGEAYTGTQLDPGQKVTDAPGVFMVDTTMMGSYGAGTGFIVGEKGLAVTNYHVVDSSSRVDITLADSGKRYEATVLGRDSSRDVAVLQINTKDELPVASISTDSPRYGDRTASVGNGGGQGYLTSVVGTVQNTFASITIQPEETGMESSHLFGLIQTSSDVVPGYSGGPTVDAEGQIIGMTTASSDGKTAADVDGYAVPIMDVMEVVAQVLTGEETDTVSIGMGGALGVIVTTDVSGSVIIQEVFEGSSAEEIGLKEDDRLLSMDGKTITSGAQLSATLRAKSSGDQVVIEWEDSSGQRHSETATLQEAVVN